MSQRVARCWLPPLVLLGTGLTSLVFEVEAGAALEYHRERVAAGEFWRLVTGQLVHWSTTMLV
ncbi:MAG: hypothetical protein ACREMC_09720, partial [Gemmatimonadales bacterium]